MDRFPIGRPFYANEGDNHASTTPTVAVVTGQDREVLPPSSGSQKAREGLKTNRTHDVPGAYGLQTAGPSGLQKAGPSGLQKSSGGLRTNRNHDPLADSSSSDEDFPMAGYLVSCWQHL